MLPAHIMVDRCTSISEALGQCQDDKAVSVEVFLVCIQLYYQISAFHIRKKVIRDLCTKNVVQTLTGTQRRWTLLEYCSTVASGTESTHVPLVMTTPEVCTASCHTCTDPCLAVRQQQGTLYCALSPSRSCYPVDGYRLSAHSGGACCAYESPGSRCPRAMCLVLGQYRLRVNR